MPEQMVQQGYFYGVLDVYFAMMTQEESLSTPPSYETPDILGASIEVTVTPAYREGKLHASNVTKRNLRRVDTYAVKLNVDNIPYAKIAKVLGRKKDANSVQLVSGNANPPNVAIGFACTLDDGTMEYWWLYKGTFAELTKTAKTDGEKLEYQTPTIEGTFVRRQDNNDLAAIADSADTDIPKAVFDSWFTKVYEPATDAAGGGTGETEEP